MPPEAAEAAAPVSETTVDDGAVDSGSNFDEGGDAELANFFGEKPAEQESPKERGAPPAKTEQPAEKPAATNHQDVETEKPETDEFDEELLAWGDAQGYTPEDARAFPNAESFRRTLVANDRRELARLKAQAGGAKAPEGPKVDAPKQETAPAPKPTDAAQAASLLQKFKMEIDPDALDERAAAKFMEFNDHVHGAFESMSQKLAEYEKRFGELDAKFGQSAQDVSSLIKEAQRTQWTRTISAADTFFNSQKAFASQLGTGTVKDIKQGSPEYQTRNDILLDALQLQTLDRNAGRESDDIEPYLKRALNTRNWDQAKEIARKELAAEVAERKKSGVARPTQRRSPSVSRDAQALQFVRKQFRGTSQEAGMPRDELNGWE